MMVCAFLHEQWDRAVLVSPKIKETLQSVKVFFVDWGTVGFIPFSNVRRLDKEYLDIPKLAHRASLHGIKPVDGKSLFDHDTTIKFVNKVTDKTFSTEIVKYHKEVRI
jgi:Tudor domain